MSRTVDVAVVGAGPAGIGSALAAARCGARVLLIDENEAPGGHLRWTISPQSGFAPDVPKDLRGFELAIWAASALAEAGVEVLSSTIAWGLFEGNMLGITSPSSTFQLQAQSVILATGSTDLVWPFPGWELPGVMTATAALRLLHLDRVLPGRDVVIVGAGDAATAVANDLTSCGATSIHLVSSVESLRAGGDGRVEWVEASGKRIPADAVVLSLGCQPDAQLSFQAQVAMSYAEPEGGFVVVRGDDYRTSDSGIYVVGSAAGACTAARAYAEGDVAGRAATGGSGLDKARERARQAAPSNAAAVAAPTIADETLVCRCEEVRAGVMRNAIADGAATINDLKRRTRGGMGICQGVYCQRAMASLISEVAGIAVESIVPMTARPPARLIPMAAMADLEP